MEGEESRQFNILVAEVGESPLHSEASGVTLQSVHTTSVQELHEERSIRCVCLPIVFRKVSRLSSNILSRLGADSDSLAFEMRRRWAMCVEAALLFSGPLVTLSMVIAIITAAEGFFWVPVLNAAHIIIVVASITLLSSSQAVALSGRRGRTLYVAMLTGYLAMVSTLFIVMHVLMGGVRDSGEVVLFITVISIGALFVVPEHPYQVAFCLQACSCVGFLVVVWLDEKRKLAEFPSAPEKTPALGMQIAVRVVMYTACPGFVMLAFRHMRAKLIHVLESAESAASKSTTINDHNKKLVNQLFPETKAHKLYNKEVRLWWRSPMDFYSEVSMLQVRSPFSHWCA